MALCLHGANSHLTKGNSMDLFKQAIINKVCFGKKEEEVKAIKRLSKKEVKGNPYNLDLQILTQYAIIN
tara:strand:+ start:524 stop:730 length:207 start_codon:yes stop_codon:yes gene_type:complete